MKIAVVIDTWFPAVGGGQINAWEISSRLASKDLLIDIVTRNNGDYLLPKNKFLNIYKLGNTSKPEDPLSKIIFSMSAFFFVLKKNYDLIHTHPFLPAPFLKIVSLIKNTPIILTVHGTRLFEDAQQITPGRILEWIILTRIKYDLVISVTYAFKKIKNVNQKIEVIPNGVYFQKFQLVKVKKAPYPKILWVGRFDKVKQLDKLIKIMPSVFKKIPNAKLFLVGYGYEEAKLKKQVRVLNLEKQIIFTGKMEGTDLIRQYKSSHLFVLPSASEGQPLTLLEAAAAELPIISTNVGGIGEIFDNREGKQYIKFSSINNFSKAIISILRSGKRSMKYTLSNKFNWDKIAEETKKIYLKELKHNV